MTVTRGIPLRAIAVASGYDASPEARADYRITGKVTAGALNASNQSGLVLKADGTVFLSFRRSFLLPTREHGLEDDANY